MRLLLHICCANCAIYPLDRIRRLGIEFAGLWFNPNIHPYQEYRMRLESLQRLSEEWRFPVIYNHTYDLNLFLKRVIDTPQVPERCAYCYRLRLEETAKRAKEEGAEAFSTSLIVSPYQRYELIVEIGKELAERYNIEFFFEDMRSHYRDGLRISKELGLYRQKYCGCIYSEAERFMNKR